MKIAVLGCGAVGSLYAARFAQNPEHSVLCVVKSPAHAQQIRQSGITITDSTGAILVSASPEAVCNTSRQTPADLVLISVKSHTTAEAMAEHGALFGPRTAALTLQNGYGNHEDILSKVPAGRILMGTTAMGVIQFRRTLQKSGMKVENISRICFTSRRTADQQGKCTVRNCMLT